MALQLGLLKKCSSLWNLLLNNSDGCVHAAGGAGGDSDDRLEVIRGVITEEKQLMLQFPCTQNGTLEMAPI